jgi:hypothetical protein
MFRFFLFLTFKFLSFEIVSNFDIRASNFLTVVVCKAPKRGVFEC